MRFALCFHILLTLAFGASSSDVHVNLGPRQRMDVEFAPNATMDRPHNHSKTWFIKITNLSYRQPFSHTFVMTHNSSAAPLFALGRPSTPAFAYLAEIGGAALLVTNYTNATGVSSALFFRTEPIMPGKSANFTVETSPEFPFISFATMLVHTNDGFVGFSNIKPMDRFISYSPVYDAGSETNDELCSHIPGPACHAFNKTNTDAEDEGEGFVHIHRGMQGVGDLDRAQFDWRNPVMQVSITRNDFRN
jgi:Spondin_N